MNYAKAQYKIYRGYAKAASKLGTSYSVYRSTTGIIPISSSNLVTSVLMTANVSWDYTKANKYHNSVWQLIVDGRIVKVGDYLVGSSTFFILSMQELLPILGVKCDRYVTVTRPTRSNTSSKGNVGTVGYTVSDETVLLQECPASFLSTAKGDQNPIKLPTDPKLSWFNCFLPFLGGVYIYPGDILRDGSTERRYYVMNNEKTELGWNLLLQHLGT